MASNIEKEKQNIIERVIALNPGYSIISGFGILAGFDPKWASMPEDRSIWYDQRMKSFTNGSVYVDVVFA